MTKERKYKDSTGFARGASTPHAKHHLRFRLLSIPTPFNYVLPVGQRRSPPIPSLLSVFSMENVGSMSGNFQKSNIDFLNKVSRLRVKCRVCQVFYRERGCQGNLGRKSQKARKLSFGLQMGSKMH